jgi:hypothetical protein
MVRAGFDENSGGASFDQHQAHVLSSNLAALQPVLDGLDLDKSTISNIHQALNLLPSEQLETQQLFALIISAYIGSRTSLSHSTANEVSELTQLVCRIFNKAKEISCPGSDEIWRLLPDFTRDCVDVAYKILEKVRYANLHESESLFVACLKAVEAPCLLYAQFQGMYSILVKNLLDTAGDTRELKLFNLHLYNYAWMLVIFAIGQYQH